jgi:hypothetical protein
MSRVITLFLAVLMTSAAVLSSEAKAQQANLRQVQDADRNLLHQTQNAADPQNTQPPGNRNLLAIDALNQKGDTEGIHPV